MTAARKVVGRPFQKGADPRRNQTGRPPPLLSRAITATLTDTDAQAIIKVVIGKATDGDIEAIKLLWDRLEGKAIARNESGDPGAFDLDLSDVDTAQLKAALKRVK